MCVGLAKGVGEEVDGRMKCGVEEAREAVIVGEDRPNGKVSRELRCDGCTGFYLSRWLGLWRDGSKHNS